MTHNHDALTAQEYAILLLLPGRTNTEIGRQLSYARSTVRNCVCTILRKTGSRNRTELAVRYMRGELRLFIPAEKDLPFIPVHPLPHIAVRG